LPDETTSSFVTGFIYDLLQISKLAISLEINERIGQRCLSAYAAYHFSA
jgi:hypothetical protein